MPSSTFDDFTFPHNFEIEVTELPGGGGPTRVFYYPGASELGGSNGLMLKVTTPDRAPWIGVFARGRYGNPALSDAVITLPGDRFCVVCEGSGYIVSAADPNEWQEVAIFPITDLRVVASHDLVVFADFTNLRAYGASGEVWNSGRLVWDDLKIVRIEPEHIVARGWNAPDDSVDEFTVDLASGEPQGQPYNWPDR